MYQYAQSLPEGKKDSGFKKKPELALELIDKSLEKGYKPGIVIIDSGYGNNTNFLFQLEKRKLKYLGGLAKNRKVKLIEKSEKSDEIRLDALAESLASDDFSEIIINLEKPRKVWVVTVEVEISRLQGNRKIANATASHASLTL